MTEREFSRLQDAARAALRASDLTPGPTCPSDGELHGFLTPGAPPELLGRVSLHLRTGCLPCAARLLHIRESVPVPAFGGAVVASLRESLERAAVYIPGCYRSALGWIMGWLEGGPDAGSARPAQGDPLVCSVLGGGAQRPETSPFVLTALTSPPRSLRWEEGPLGAPPYTVVFNDDAGERLTAHTTRQCEAPWPEQSPAHGRRCTWTVYNARDERHARGMFWMLTAESRAELEAASARCDSLAPTALAAVAKAAQMADLCLFGGAVDLAKSALGEADAAHQVLLWRLLAAVYLAARIEAESDEVGWPIPEGSWLGSLAEKALRASYGEIEGPRPEGGRQ